MTYVRLNTFMALLAVIFASGAFAEVHALEQSPPRTINMVAPPGLRSVSSSPTADSMLRQVTAGNSAMTMLDAYLTPADIGHIDRGQEPAKDRYVVVFSPRDSRFRHPTQQVFASMVTSVRKSFLDQQEIDHANAYMKARGEDGKLLQVSGNRVLVDLPDCFAKLVVGKYDFANQHARPPMNMVQAYVWIHGEMVVVDAYAKGSDANREWLLHDVRSWLGRLGKP